MWSNTAPSGGIILIGVEDDGTITGCSAMDQGHKNTIETTHVFCEDARYTSKQFPVKNNKGSDDYVIAFRIFYRPDKVVETSDGRAFMREGSTKVEIAADLKRELQITKGQIHYELEPVPLRYPEDFDQGEVQNFCRAYAAVRKLTQPKSFPEILELAKLGKRSGNTFHPNLAGCLLLARDPTLIIPGSKIRIIKYEGIVEKFGEDQNSIYSEIVEGPIVKMIDIAKEKIAAQLRYYQQLTSTGRLERRPEYPEVAWLEAIVNAVAHRSYNLKTQNIFVKIFDDRMIVESPGGFVPPTNEESIYDAHNPRNPHLMTAMMHLDLTFCAYEGTRRMREAMIASSLPTPRFKQISAQLHKVSVTLENDLKSRNRANHEYGGLEEKEYAGLSREERYIVNYLSENDGLTVSAAAILIQKSKPTASKILNDLSNRNILYPFVKGRPAHVRPKTYSLKER